MHLIINTKGSSFRREGECFVITTNNQTKVAAKKVDQITLATAVSISTDAINLAIEHGIGITLVDKYGKVYGRVWEPSIKKSAEVRRKQLLLRENVIGAQLVRFWLTSQISKQQYVLNKFKRGVGKGKVDFYWC